MCDLKRGSGADIQFSLRFWDTGLDTLDLAGTETRKGTLVFGSGEVRTHGAFEVGDGGAGRGLPFANFGGRHGQWKILGEGKWRARVESDGFFPPCSKVFVGPEVTCTVDQICVRKSRNG